MLNLLQELISSYKLIFLSIIHRTNLIDFLARIIVPIRVWRTSCEMLDLSHNYSIDLWQYLEVENISISSSKCSDTSISKICSCRDPNLWSYEIWFDHFITRLPRSMASKVFTYNFIWSCHHVRTSKLRRLRFHSNPFRVEVQVMEREKDLQVRIL